jgi:thioesterase domain-containing protein
MMRHFSADDDVDWKAFDDLPVVGFHMTGSRPPMVLIRTWTNELQGHALLAGALGVDQPLVSLGVEMTADDFPRSVSEWADRVVESALLHIDPDRALLGGFSFGGVVALEIAARIQRSGGRAGQVLLIDTSIPRPKERARPGLILAAARRVVETMEERRKPSEQVRELAIAVWRAPGVVFKRARRSLKRRSERRGGGGVKEPNMSFRQRAIWIAYLTYEPVPLNLSAAILTTQESVERTGNDCCLGWSQTLAGPIRTYSLPGKHFSVMKPEVVGECAAALAIAIEAPPSANPDVTG